MFAPSGERGKWPPYSSYLGLHVSTGISRVNYGSNWIGRHRRRNYGQDASGLAGRFGIRSEAHEGRVKEGGILLSVHCDSSEWIKRAKQVLERTGAQDVSSSGEASSDNAMTTRDLPRAV